MNRMHEKADAPGAAVVVCAGGSASACLIAVMLARQGLTVRTAKDGPDAVSRLRETGADLLVLDLDDPASGVPGVLAEIPALARRPYTLVLAGRRPAKELERQAQGADEVWTKPVDAARLAGRCRAVAQDGNRRSAR